MLIKPNRVDSIQDFEQLRQQMVEDHIKARGIQDTAVLKAMATVPRECFVPESMRLRAYEDGALPILNSQTISQPYIVARMMTLLHLKSTDKVLEVGTGSGYAAAVLSLITQNVFTVERHESLVHYARQHLSDLGYDNVHVKHSDGTMGWPKQAPYDAILVSAGGPRVPTPLCMQLAVNGRLVMPVGSDQRHQRLVRIYRLSETKFTTEKLESVAFVPLIGKEGWEKDKELY